MTTGYATRETATLALLDAVAEVYPAGCYFTDGMSLYRIAGWLSRPIGPDLVEIEDCVSLDRILVGGEDLKRLRLRAVHGDADTELVGA